MISVLIPNYNHAAYIRKAVEAVMTQTLPPDEIILIDDASTDNSREVMTRLAQEHPQIKLILREKNGGVVSGMNEGLALGKGDLIAFLAADDMVFPQFLERSAAMLTAHPEAAFCSACVELRDSSGAWLGERPMLRPSATARYIPADEMRRLFLRGDNFFLGAATVYRKSSLLTIGGFDGALGSASDGVAQRRLAVRTGACFVPEHLAVWRITGLNYSTSSVMKPETLDKLVAANVQAIEAEPAGLFPPAYAATLARRLRFNAARLVAGTLANDPGQAVTVAHCIKAGPVETSLLKFLGKAGSLAPTLVTAWLTVKLRPFSLIWLMQEFVARRLAPSRPATLPMG